MSVAYDPLQGEAEGPLDDTAQKDALLMAILPDVVFDGWSRAALRRASRSVGLTCSETAELLPGGIAELARWLDIWADRQMVLGMETHDLAVMKMRDKVTLGIRLKLEVLAPHRQAVRKALAMNCSPLGTMQSLQAVYQTIDTIWRLAGDTSTDFNFYTKRGLLAAVYASTVLFWLDDRSEDLTATWSFLDRRIGNVMRIPSVTSRLKDNARRLFTPIALRRRKAG